MNKNQCCGNLYFLLERKDFFGRLEKIEGCCENATHGQMLHFRNTKSATKSVYKTFIEEKSGGMVPNMSGMEIACYRVIISESE